MLVLGIVAAGGVFTGTNPGYTPRELAHHVSVTKAKIFVVEPEVLSPLLEAVKQAQIQDAPIFLFNHDDSRATGRLPLWTSLLEHGEEDWPRFDDEQTAKNTTAMLLTTSGTTGLPKAAMISHANLIAEHTLGWEINLPRQPWETRSLVALPMFHAAMAPFAHTSVLRSGFVTHIMRRFDVDEYMQAIDRYKPTVLIMVPPVVLRIVMSPTVGKYDLTSIQRAYVGAAPLDPELQRRFEPLVDAPLTQGIFPPTHQAAIEKLTDTFGVYSLGNDRSVLPHLHHSTSRKRHWVRWLSDSKHRYQVHRR
jgi:acyl-CoA synthetase (AMP-forming)/AMP-acid ligase II